MRRRKPTIKDIAALAGVSKTTVGYVLNGRMDIAISARTRERILKAAEELSYRPNKLASGFARGRSQTIGVIDLCSGLAHGYQEEFVSRVMYGIEEVCREHNHPVFITRVIGVTDPVDMQIASLFEHKVGALIFIGAGTPEIISQVRGVVREAMRDGIQCLIIDENTLADTVDCVITDDMLGATKAMTHLLGLGYKRISYVKAAAHTSTSRMREAGYMAALRKAGIEIDDNLMVQGFCLREDAARAVAKLFESGTPPEAVFAYNDYTAAALLQAANERKIRVPEDLAVVGYGDLQLAEWLSLTTVRQNPEEMGRQGARRIFERMKTPNAPPQEMMLPVELVIRRSCGCDEASAVPAHKQHGEALSAPVAIANPK